MVFMFLAFADFLAGIGAFVTIAQDSTAVSSYFARNSLCRVHYFFVNLSGFGNFFSYMLMTIDRYWYIERPMQYVSIGRCKSMLCPNVLKM